MPISPLIPFLTDSLATPPVDPIRTCSNHYQSNTVKCTLLDSFAIAVQFTLAITIFLALLFKRYKERPQRPVRIWALDLSKQCVGAGVIHLLNLIISYLSGQSLDGLQTNLCVWYFLNTAIDTTLGVAILWFWLQLLTQFAVWSEIAPEGYTPSQNTTKHWWFETSVFVTAEILMKLCVVGLFHALPLFAIAETLLAWTGDNGRHQVVFVMLIFPLLTNCAQFWLVDTMLMKKAPVRKSCLEANPVSFDSDYSGRHKSSSYGSFR
ncbi:vacuolar membrane protein-domain-containing protein [Spinellus fusiger]|nr:vacuolar membrane protein-domain-containing protein [Spinellus fusiger]